MAAMGTPMDIMGRPMSSYVLTIAGKSYVREGLSAVVVEHEGRRLLVLGAGTEALKHLAGQHNQQSHGRGRGAGAADAQVQTIAGVESQIAELPTEHAAGIDNQGNLLFQKAGGESEVNLSYDELAITRGGVFTHNHPAGVSFSVDDVQTAWRFGFAQMRAVTTQHVHIVEPPAGGWPDPARFDRLVIPAIQKHANAIAAEWNPRIARRELSQEQANRDFDHELWLRVAGDVGFRYRREART